jgi:hypothetical protein
MPLTIADLHTLETYLAGVLDRSEHHAEHVGAIALALIGAVLWRKDAAPIEVRTHAGKTANILWVQISRRRYALAYNHVGKCIELRERTLNGATIAQFNNSTPVIEVWRVFEEL